MHFFGKNRSRQRWGGECCPCSTTFLTRAPGKAKRCLQAGTGIKKTPCHPDHHLVIDQRVGGSCTLARTLLCDSKYLIFTTSRGPLCTSCGPFSLPSSCQPLYLLALEGCSTWGSTSEVLRSRWTLRRQVSLTTRIQTPSMKASSSPPGKQAIKESPEYLSRNRDSTKELPHSLSWSTKDEATLQLRRALGPATLEERWALDGAPLLSFLLAID